MDAARIMTAPAITVGPHVPIKEAARSMVDHDIGALPVVNDDNVLMGIVTESDLAPYAGTADPDHRLTPTSRKELAITVGSVMTREVIALPSAADVSTVADMMSRHHVRRIPIVRQGRVAGIVTQHDLLRVLVRRDEAIRHDVERLLDEKVGVLGHHEVRVWEGVVTLRSDESIAARRLAARLTATVPGVLKVDTKVASVAPS